MNQNIVKYLQENKEKFPEEILAQELLKAGHLQQEIQEAVSFIYDKQEKAASDNVSVPVGAQSSFWEFKIYKVYANSSEKWKDFLFGFFAPFLMGLVANVVPLVGPIAVFVFYIFAFVYFFKRRRFIFYGMLAELIAVPVLIIIILISIFGTHSIL